MSGIYGFTIELKDGVTKNAKAANDAVFGLSKEMTKLRAQMVKDSEWLRKSEIFIRDKQAKEAVALAAKYDKQMLLHEKQIRKDADAFRRGELALRIQEEKAAADKEVAIEQDAFRRRQRIRAGFARVQSRVNAPTAAPTGGGEGGGFGALALGVIGGATALIAQKVASAITMAASSLVSFAVEARQARADMISVFGALGEMEVSGEQVVNMLDRLSAQFGRTREEMAPSTKAFMAMGIRDIPTLTRSVTAASAAFGLLGETAESEFVNIVARAQQAKEAGIGLILPHSSRNVFAKMGIDIDEVAKKMGTTSKALALGLKSGGVDAQKFTEALEDALTEKGLGALGRFTQNFGQQIKRLKQSFGDAFKNVNIQPITVAMEYLIKLFDQNTVSGAVFSEMITSVFNEVSKDINMILGFFSLMFLRIELAYLKFQDWSNAMKALFEKGDWFTIGQNVVLGFIEGMLSEEPDMLNTIQSRFKIANDMWKMLWGVQSPSKVAAKIGSHVAEGFNVGFEKESDNGAAVGLMSPSSFQSSGFAATAPTNQTNSSSKTEVNVRLDVHLTGSSPHAVAQELTEEAVSLVFERLALANGL